MVIWMRMRRKVAAKIIETIEDIGSGLKVEALQ